MHVSVQVDDAVVHITNVYSWALAVVQVAICICRVARGACFMQVSVQVDDAVVHITICIFGHLLLCISPSYIIRLEDSDSVFSNKKKIKRREGGICKSLK